MVSPELWFPGIVVSPELNGVPGIESVSPELNPNPAAVGGDDLAAARDGLSRIQGPHTLGGPGTRGETIGRRSSEWSCSPAVAHGRTAPARPLPTNSASPPAC